MELYLAGEYKYHKMMDVGTKTGRYSQPDRLRNDPNRINLLQSFWYARKNKNYTIIQNSNTCNIMIDSGAFTFMQKGFDIDLERYTDEYCDEWYKEFC